MVYYLSKPWLSIIIAFVVLLYPAYSTAQLPKRSDIPTSYHYALVISKSKNRVIVFTEGKPKYTFPIATLGWNPRGTKTMRGDGKTPEGEYYVIFKNPESICHRSLQINYPNEKDAERGLADRLITREQEIEIVTASRTHTAPPQNTSLGGDIFLHGYSCLRHTTSTYGCIALSDADAEKLFNLIPLGTPVTIQP